MESAPVQKAKVDTGYTIMEPGTIFNGYKILSLLNKDSEGLKYIAEKNGRQYLLKLLFQVGFASVDNLYLQQMRLSRIAGIKSEYFAKIVEVNLSDDPCYMVADYVKGKSLAELREEIPEEKREAFISAQIGNLISVAQDVRKHGLSIASMAMTGVMVSEAGKLVVLSSTVKFEEADEREDIFVLGTLVAQFLAPGGLHRLIYATDQLRLSKFTYIEGVSLSLNKLLAECLHRNILQRVTDLDSLAKAWKNLPPLEEDTIWESRDKLKQTSSEDSIEAPKPKTGQDWRFWALIVLSIVAVVLLTIWLSITIGNAKGEAAEYTPSEEADTTHVVNGDRFREGDTITSTGYAEARQNLTRRREQQPLPQRQTSTPVQPVTPRRAPVPSSFVYVDAGTFGFGRLTENNHNVSLSGFYISKYELTQQEWNAFMRPASVSSIGDRFPVENITWRQIITYCNGRSDAENLKRAYTITGSGANEVIRCDFSANGYRLPTEAEWEYAAKAGYLYNYSGSDEPDRYAWFRGNAANRVHQVGTKSPNDFGLYDMTGNVAEWVWDWYSDNPVRNLDSFVNPRGPGSGSQRTIRGGNILNGEGRNLNILYREKGSPNQAYPYVGFRLVRSH